MSNTLTSLSSNPLVSVVIPSFNQAKYLGDAIQSINNQNYGNVEIIVIDGGSSDGSVEVIKSFEKSIHYWQSKADKGQAAAINIGFEKSKGDILCWLNSDDYLLPGALEKAVDLLICNQLSLVFGNCIHLDEDSNVVYGSDVSKAHKEIRLNTCDYIVQPSTFWTRCVWEEVGRLNEDLFYTLDWDWYLRAQQKSVNFIPTSSYLSTYRIHSEHKTGTGGKDRNKEIDELFEQWNSKTTYNAIVQYRQSRQKIQFLSHNLMKARMKKHRNTILRHLFPTIFENISLAEAEASYLMLS